MVEYLEISQQDCFIHGALNKTGAELYWRMLGCKKTITEIQKITQLSRSTINRALDRMSHLTLATTGQPYPIVVRIGKRWTAVENVDFDLVAEILGVAGRREKRIKHHLEDRTRFRKLGKARFLNTKKDSKEGPKGRVNNKKVFREGLIKVTQLPLPGFKDFIG